MNIARTISNPNTDDGANRIPSKVELTTLHASIEQGEKPVEHFDLQLGEASAMLGTIHGRYDDQCAALECTPSELDATNDLLKTTQSQNVTVKTDLNKLDGFPHPIHRCNDDELRYIFEWAVQLIMSQEWLTPPKEWFRCATRISHVCRRWYNLALRTPLLWMYVDIRMDREPADVGSFWERTVSRIGQGIPPIISLVISGPYSEQKALRTFGFHGVQHIRSLNIELWNPDCAIPLFNLILGRLSVDQLYLNMPIFDTDILDELAFQEGLLAFLRKPQNLTSVHIRGPVLSSFTTYDSPFPNVKRLKLADITAGRSISLTCLARLFPNVETLELVKATFTLDQPGETLWSMVHTLAMEYVYVPWADLRLPNLFNLSITDSMDNGFGELSSFINNHSFLQHLTPLYAYRELSRILDAISYLQILTTCYWEGLGDPSRSCLGKVGDLRILESIHHRLSPKSLEKIIRNRFNGRTSDRIHVVGTNSPAMLRILVPYCTDEKKLGWLSSEIVSKALENVTQIEVGKLMYDSYNLKLYDV